MNTPTPSIGTIHTTALRLSGVLNAVAFLENAGECKEGQSALIFLAEELGQELENALDRYSTEHGAECTRGI